MAWTPCEENAKGRKESNKTRISTRRQNKEAARIVTEVNTRAVLGWKFDEEKGGSNSKKSTAGQGRAGHGNWSNKQSRLLPMRL